MARGYMRPRNKYLKPRKFGGLCEMCGEKKKENEVYCYIDGNNYAISYNSPYLCIDCYIKKYERDKNENH